MYRGRIRISSLVRVQVLAALCARTLAAQNQAASLKVAAVQFRSSFHVADNVKRMTEILARLADDHVKVAVFPECALTGYDEGAVRSAGQGEVAAAETRLRETCRRYGIAAIVGSVYKVNGRIYNSAVVLDSHGELVERYAKIHLAGEKWFTPGNHVSFF